MNAIGQRVHVCSRITTTASAVVPAIGAAAAAASCTVVPAEATACTRPIPSLSKWRWMYCSPASYSIASTYIVSACRQSMRARSSRSRRQNIRPCQIRESSGKPTSRGCLQPGGRFISGRRSCRWGPGNEDAYANVGAFADGYTRGSGLSSEGTTASAHRLWRWRLTCNRRWCIRGGW